MCGRFTGVTWDELLEVARAIERGASFNPMPDSPARKPEFFPKSRVPILITDAKDRSVRPDQLIWGYDLEGRKSIVFNTRIESAAKSFLWKDSFYRRHCVIPMHAFYESSRDQFGINPRTDKTVKQSYRFEEPDGGLLLAAGIWKDDRFSMLTTAPNKVVSAVHDRMPLIVDKKGASDWLNGSAEATVSDKTDELLSEAVYPFAEVN